MSYIERCKTVITVLAMVGLAVLTPATPAPAQTLQLKTHLGGKPSGLVTLVAAVPPSSVLPAEVVTAEGGIEGPFNIPVGSVFVLTVRIPAESITESGRSRSAIPACRSRRSEATLGVAYLADFG